MTLTQITEKGIKDGEIVNADINANAAIAKSKLASLDIVNADVNSSAAIGKEKLEDFVSDNVNNRLLTATGSTNSLQGESSFTYNGNGGLDMEGTSAAFFQIKTPNNTDGGVYFRTGTSNNGAISYLHNSTVTDGVMNFRSGGTTKMVIKGDGKVGIGTTDPAYTLDVVGDGGGSFSASSNSTQGQISIVGKNSSGGVSAISRIKSYPDGSSNQSHMAFETRNSSNSMVEAMRITSDQKIGIGTTSPVTNFEVVEGSTGQSETQKRIAVFRKNGTAVGDEGYIHLTTMAGHYGVKLGFANEGGSPSYLNQGFFISTVNSGENITNHTKKFVILSNGMVGIGKTNPFYLLHLQDASSCKLGFSNTDSGLDQDQLIGGLEFTKSDGSGAGAGLCGSINVKSDDSYGARTYMQFKVRSNSTGAAATDTEICRMTPRGLQFFGDTASSSALDDYEEGTWTPSNPTSGLYNDHSLSGHYQKIGKFVHFQFQCRFNSNSSSVNAVIDDFPFTSAESGANYDYGGSVMYKTNSNIGGVLIENGGSRFYIYNTGGSNLNCASMSNHYIRVHGFVEVT